MSSHRLSVSGDRPYTLSSGGAFEAVQYNAKAGDRAQVLASNFGEIVAVLPQTAVIERYKVPAWSHRDDKQHTDDKGEPVFSEYVILRIPGPAGITLMCLQPEGQNMPHTNVDVRKDDGSDPLAAVLGSRAELLETTPLKSPPTE